MSVFDKLRKIISNNLGVPEEEILPGSHLQDDLNSDPLSISDLIISIEDNFKIKIPQEEISKFNTVEDITNYLIDSHVE